jgi:hypothetical protein
VNIGVIQPGSSQSNLFANASTSANNDGSVNVAASAGADFLNFGSLFDIGNVSSTETLTEQASSPPVVKGTFQLGTISLLGLSSGISNPGLSLLGTGIALPLSTSVLPALNSLLSAVGVTLSYLPETFLYTDGTSSTGATPDAKKALQGVDSGALKVSITQNVPTQGPVTAAFTLGRVYLSATDTPSIDAGGTVPSTSSTATPDLGSTGSIAPGPGISSSLPSADLPSIGSSPQTGGPSAPPETVGQSLSPLHIVSDLGKFGNSLYLFLVIAGLAALATSQLMRMLAVRLSLNRKR